MQGIVFVIIGFLVAATSAYLNMRTGTMKMVVFIAVGIGMMVYGFICMNRDLSAPKKPVHHPAQHHPQQAQHPQYARQQQL